MSRRTANDGLETDNINQKGSGPYTYEPCAVGSSICSAPLTMVFLVDAGRQPADVLSR